MKHTLRAATRALWLDFFLAEEQQANWRAGASALAGGDVASLFINDVEQLLTGHITLKIYEKL